MIKKFRQMGIYPNQVRIYHQDGRICKLRSDINELNKISNFPSQVNGNLNHRTGFTSLNHETERKSNNFFHRNHIDYYAWRIMKCQHSS